MCIRDRQSTWATLADDKLKLFSNENFYFKVEKKFKGSVHVKKTQQELFEGQIMKSKLFEYKNVIVAYSLDTKIFQHKNEVQDRYDLDKGEEAPALDSISTQDIHNFSSKHQGGLILNQEKDARRRGVFHEESGALPAFFYNDNKNNFCYSS
eukprot:TRINITY_DN67188_c0_g1_i2.p1 TRINITY_DN67188_c0_g1~~TRINITY_DN67188_c0_g1_i2.p1  ORF type:complete len:152 (+),score=17.21 TRINITY_DN67188_c0_g1_i2:126-581(+)